MIIIKDRVASFSYTLTNKREEILDSSSEAEPYFYLHGHNSIIPGLEKAMEGRDEGEKFKVTVPAAEAYGERDERLIFDIPTAHFNDAAERIEPGMQFQAETPVGDRLLTITRIGDGFVTVDANHPLAGEELIFDVTVVSVRQATEEELEYSHQTEGCCSDCGEAGGSTPGSAGGCSCGCSH